LNVKDYPIGERVELSPGTDAWMSGDRYGVVVNHGTKYAWVRMGRSGRVLKLLPELLKMGSTIPVTTAAMLNGFGPVTPVAGPPDAPLENAPLEPLSVPLRPVPPVELRLRGLRSTRIYGQPQPPAEPTSRQRRQIRRSHGVDVARCFLGSGEG